MAKIYMPSQEHNTWMMNGYLRDMREEVTQFFHANERCNQSAGIRSFAKDTRKRAALAVVQAQTNAIAFASR